MNYKNLSKLAQKRYKHFEVTSIAKTVCDRKIYKWSCIFDNTRPFVLLQGAIHAREFVTSDVLMRFIELIEEDYENLKDIGTPNIVIIPMVNPDGVELVKHGLKSVPQKFHNRLLKINNYNQDFSMFKANVRGVDLNNNFDAKWERQKHSIFPASSGFKGESAASEIETRALIQESKLYSVAFTLSFHSKGEEIYYTFYQKGERKKRDRCIAKLLSKITGYKIRNVERSSSGGYKDWCIEKLKIPAITIEMGSDNLVHPLGEKYAKNIFYNLKDICYTLCDITNIIGEYDESGFHENRLGFGKKSKTKR